MKRTKGKFFALIVAVIMAAGVLSSCSLVSVNVDKDMQQVVATVQIDGAEKENIIKRELVEGYLSYGFYYQSNYGYTTSQVYDLILNNLTNNKVIVQYARTKANLAAKDPEAAVEGYLDLPKAELLTSYGKDKVEYIRSLLKYIDGVQAAQAAYDAKTLLNNYLDSFDTTEEDEADEVEDETVTARTVPTVDEADGEALDEDYIEAYEDKLGGMTTVEELEDNTDTTVPEKTIAYYTDWRITKYTSFSINATTTARKKAVNEFVTTFTENGLIPDDEKAKLGTGENMYLLTNYSYYLDILASNLESQLITKFEDKLTDDAESEINDATLFDDYLNTYKTQKSTYTKDITAYESALDGKTSDSYVLYNPDLGEAHYGYVANILIGFSDDASAALTAFNSKALSEESKRAYREELLKGLVAKDQRATWLQNGYYELDDKTKQNDPTAYAFGEDYVKTDVLKQFDGKFVDKTDYTRTTKTDAYLGDGKWGEKEEEDYKVNFRNIVPNEYLFETFFNKFFNSESGLKKDASKTLTIPSDADYAYAYPKYGYGYLDFTNEENKQFNKDLISDLHFAFSTDTGILSKEYGYLYSPKTSSTQYVAEFAEAAKIVVEAGEGAYIVAATDYGYHIIVCMEQIQPSVAPEYANADAFKADLEKEGTVAYRYRKAKLDANVTTIVSDTVTYYIAKYVDEEDSSYAIKKYEKTLKNLIDSAS